MGHILDTIEGKLEQGTLSDKVVIRIGHATHASPEQLDRIRLLESKGVKIHVEANLTSNLTTGSVKDAKEQREVLLRFLNHGVVPTLNTDGGGVMGTTLRQEKTLAQNIIAGFKSNQVEITENNTKYYYSELPSLANRDPRFEYRLIPEENKRNFEMDKIEKETEDYRQEIIPKFHSIN